MLKIVDFENMDYAKFKGIEKNLSEIQDEFHSLYSKWRNSTTHVNENEKIPVRKNNKKSVRFSPSIKKAGTRKNKF